VCRQWAIGGLTTAALALPGLLLSAVDAAARPPRPTAIAIRASTGYDAIARARLVYRYPAGNLKDDFSPPSWAEIGGRACQARLVLMVPTMQNAAEELAGTSVERGSARIPYLRRGRTRGTLGLRWMATREWIAGTTYFLLSASITAPRDLQPEGSVVSLAMFGAPAQTGTDDLLCAAPALEPPALGRIRTAALKIVRGLRLTT
jgi:hypothetical protein